MDDRKSNELAQFAVPLPGRGRAGLSAAAPVQVAAGAVCRAVPARVRVRALGTLNLIQSIHLDKLKSLVGCQTVTMVLSAVGSLYGAGTGQHRGPLSEGIASRLIDYRKPGEQGS